MCETRVPAARESELTILRCDAGSGMPIYLVEIGDRQPREPQVQWCALVVCSSDAVLVLLLEQQSHGTGTAGTPEVCPPTRR
jgi:hypothetical protein